MISRPTRSVALSLLAAVLPYAAAAEPSPKSWTLYHAILKDDAEPSFVPRGTVKLSLKSDDAEASGTKKKKMPVGVQDDLPYGLTLEHKENVLSPEFLNSLLDDSAMYQLKLVPDDNPNAVPVITTVPACQVRRANFRDEFAMALDSNAQAISLSYMPLVSPLAPDSCSSYSQDENAKFTTFDSRLSIETTVPAMALRTVLPDYQPPPGLKAIPGARKKGAAGGPGETPLGADPNAPPVDNSFFGFIKRYWYILLPLFIMNNMSAPAEEGQQQQQQGSDSGTASAAPAGSPTAAATPTAGGAVRKRRGKRG